MKALCLSFLFTSALIASHTATPIKHIVVIFQENRTFDHYFSTYPLAENLPGETPFKASRNTPTVNGLTEALLTQNQNLFQPFRLLPSEVNTCNNDHHYTPLQEACDMGAMDMFVQANGFICPMPQQTMGYFDGNTVTAIWNYAQAFSMSDNFRGTNISQSTVGAINLVSGQAHGVPSPDIPNKVAEGTIINDIDPKYDDCSVGATVELTGINVGNLLNTKSVTWGWFQGGFANCGVTHLGPNGPVIDYVPHHNPFQYYQSTSNPNHLPPSSPSMIGKTDQANHLYDISDLWTAAANGNLPSVCFIKAPQYQNGHAGNSTPLLEQEFLAATINKLQTLPEWKNMAIIIAYDDSGGWYDHEPPILVNDSQLSMYDVLTGPGTAGFNPPLGGYQGRPGYGYRLPFLLISPWAKTNFVDNTLIDQTSVLRFIEDNWDLGRIGDFSFDSFAGSLLGMFDFRKRNLRYLFLDPNTGAVEYRSH